MCDFGRYYSRFHTEYEFSVAFVKEETESMNPLILLAKRFIAGERIEDAVHAVRQLNSERLKATLDVLGENVRQEHEARRAADQYIDVIERIKVTGIESHVSLKLTQMGLDIGDDFCAANVSRIVERANRYGNFVRLDMEGSHYTQRTLDMFTRLRQAHENVGIVIQAYLYRSEKDIGELNAMGARVRLCKGAYKEPSSIAFPRKEETNANFIKLMKLLLTEGTYPAIATHDRAIIEETLRFVKERKIPREKYEFQMLYGIGRSLQRELVAGGHTVRIYVPFGTHWLPYYTRRLRERKENVFFLLKHLFGD
jgi:proline dehydrogenase